MSPTLSRFYGIVVSIRLGDHPPPHIHAKHGEFSISVAINTLDILAGHFPKASWRILEQWMSDNREDILDAWVRTKEGRPAFRIPPYRR